MTDISTEMIQIIENLMFINNLVSDNINIIKRINDLIKHKKQIDFDMEINCIQSFTPIKYNTTDNINWTKSYHIVFFLKKKL